MLGLIHILVRVNRRGWNLTQKWSQRQQSQIRTTDKTIHSQWQTAVSTLLGLFSAMHEWRRSDDCYIFRSRKCSTLKYKKQWMITLGAQTGPITGAENRSQTSKQSLLVTCGPRSHQNYLSLDDLLRAAQVPHKMEKSRRDSLPTCDARSTIVVRLPPWCVRDVGSDIRNEQ